MRNKIESYKNDIKIYVESEDNSSVKKGQLFLEWILKYLFEKSESEIEENNIREGVKIIDGKNDGSIDASFIQNNILYVIQSKYDTSHNASSLDHFSNNVEVMINGEKKDQNKKNEYYEIIDCIEEVEQIEFIYITNAIFSDSEKIIVDSQKNKIEEINNDKIIRLRFLDVLGISDFIDEALNSVPERIRGKELKLIVSNHFMNKEQTTIVAEVSLKELAKFINKEKDYLFFSNIRNFLGKNQVNKAIAETYAKKPKDFWYYNNGITIVCDEFNSTTLGQNSSTIKIKTPQIVNGCQTANTIYNSWKKETKDMQEIKEGTILVKIIKDKNSKKRKEITRYTNSQTSVTGKDFYALEDFQKFLKSKFETLGYNYEIQRKESVTKKFKGNKEYDYLFDNAFKNKFILNAKDVAQSFTAGIHLKPAKARNIGNLVPGGAYYDKLFNDTNTPSDPRYYLIPYAIMHYGKNKFKDNDKMKTANQLFISVYFRLILSIFKNIKVVNSDKEDLLDGDNSKIINILDSIFKNQKLNRTLLVHSESIMKQFLKDSSVKEKIDENLPRFLKAAIDSDMKILGILSSKIDDEIEENESLSIEIKEMI